MDTATQTDLFIPSYQESNTYAPREMPDPGFYTLELVKIADPEPQKAEYNPDGTKMRARFDFKIVGASPENEDWIGAEVSDWYNLTMFETSALYPVVKALLGGTVDPAVRPSRSLLVGRRMQAMIVVEPKKTDPSVEVAKIKSPMALTTGKRAKKPAEPEAETTNDQVPF